MTEGERDKLAKLLGFAFANNFTNQSYMRGATNVVGLLNDPTREGDQFFEGMAATVIPNFVGQLAVEQDPFIREIDGTLESIWSRVPFQREGLMARRDGFGEPIPQQERLWLGSPFTVSKTSTDKVRLEAQKIGYSAANWPKKIDTVPGLRTQDKQDYVLLTPEQRDMFASKAGAKAYKTLNTWVNMPIWETFTPLQKRRTFEAAFAQAKKQAGMDILLNDIGLDTTFQNIEEHLKRESAPQVPPQVEQ